MGYFIDMMDQTQFIQYFFDNYNFKIMMELQNNLGGIFNLVNGSGSKHIPSNQILSILQVGFQKFKKHTHVLLLTSRCLFIKKIQVLGQKQEQNIVYTANIQFELNFQIQSAPYKIIDQAHKKVLAQKIGITFYKEGGKILKLYSLDQTSIVQVRKVLKNFIHERGFHQLFTPCKKLGKGNYATAYQIINIQTSQRFAVKAFAKVSIYSAQKGKQGLKNQLQIMKQITNSSQNLLNLYDIYESQNSIYAILTLLEGRSLQNIISRDRPAGFSYEQSRYILRGILNGLKCLHQKKIMHRDLKPANIIFKKQNLQTPQQYDPVIVDYGMCQNYEKSPYLFFRCGTPGYVAPEILCLETNKPYTPACDMFSVGCLFHLILTGCAIFDSIHFQETLRRNKALQFSIRKKRVIKNHPSAMNLLQRFLDLSPQKRITAQEALNHDYFGNLKNLKGFFKVQSKVLSKVQSINNINPSITSNNLNKTTVVQKTKPSPNHQEIDLQQIQLIQRIRTYSFQKQKQAAQSQQPKSPYTPGYIMPKFYNQFPETTDNKDFIKQVPQAITATTISTPNEPVKEVRRQRKKFFE